MPAGLRLQADSAGMELKEVKSLLGRTSPLPGPTRTSTVLPQPVCLR